MSRKEFTGLIEGLFTLMALDQPERVIAGDALMINKVAFSLVQSDQIDASLMSIYADFGPIPAQLEARICKVLMEANLYLFIEQGPIFALSADQKNVLCAERRVIGKTTPEDLYELLMRLASKANEWRINYFLDSKPNAPVQQPGRAGWSKLQTTAANQPPLRNG